MRTDFPAFVSRSYERAIDVQQAIGRAHQDQHGSLDRLDIPARPLFIDGD